MSDSPPALSTPNPTTQTLVYTGLRAVLQGLGAVGVVLPVALDASAVWQLAGAVSLLVGVVWSFWSKYTAARAQHEAAVASARSGVAVAPK